MFWFEFFFISLSLASWNLWLLVNCQGKSWSKMRTTSMGYKYNTINFNHELITKCTNPLVSYWLRLWRKERISVNTYLLLHSFCVSCYLSHTQTELLIAFSLPSLYFQWIIFTLFVLYVFSCSKSLHYVYDSKNFLKKEQYLLTVQLNACII